MKYDIICSFYFLYVSIWFSKTFFSTKPLLSSPHTSPLLRYPFTHPTNPFSSCFSLTILYMLFIHSFVYRLIDCDRLLSAVRLNEFPLRQTHTHTPTLSPLRNFCSPEFEGFPRPRLRLAPPIKHRSCSSMTCSLLIGFTPPLPLVLVSFSMFPLCLDCSEKKAGLKKRDGKSERKEDKYTALF